MSRIEAATRPTLTLAGMVLTAMLVLPAVIHSQSITREQMLLNRVAPTAGSQGLAVPLAEATSAGPQPTAAGHTRLPRALELPVSYGGVSAEGVDLLWRGTTVGPLSGEATVRIAYAGSPEDRAMPVWPVTALVFFSADDYRSSFIAELSGAMDWTKGEILLTGLVTDGPATGTEVEHLLRLRDSKWNGSLLLRFQSRNTESVAAVTAKDGNDAVSRPETWINGEQALLGRVSPIKSRDAGE